MCICVESALRCAVRYAVEFQINIGTRLNALSLSFVSLLSGQVYLAHASINGYYTHTAHTFYNGINGYKMHTLVTRVEHKPTTDC